MQRRQSCNLLCFYIIIFAHAAAAFNNVAKRCLAIVHGGLQPGILHLQVSDLLYLFVECVFKVILNFYHLGPG